LSDTVDVLVIGAGPAGSTIARLLAGWDYSVLLLNGPPLRAPVAETLPPGIHDVFRTAGLRDAIDGASFYARGGTSSWCGAGEPLIEDYAAGTEAWHVDRRHFDGLLLSLAERAGAVVRSNHRAPRVALEVGAVEHDGGVSSARFVIDASGRAGLLARQIKRFWDPRYRTIALCGMLRANAPWPVDPHHTLAEFFETGWARSVPLAPDRREVSFLLDTGAVHGSLESAFQAQFERAPHFRTLFAGSALECPPFSRDASPYYSDRYAGPNWMLTGDAASFADPITSSGLTKALRSAWTGAVVVHTCLSKPDRAQAAIDLFNASESAAWLDYGRIAARRYAEGEALFGTAFWRDRSHPPGEGFAAEFARLRSPGRLKFILIEPVRCEPRPAIRGHEVVLVNRPCLAALSDTEYVECIHLATLAAMAPGFDSVRALHEAYTGRGGDVPLPAFLSALSLLVAKGVLELA
jgi:flavin-dependent dehydrogenase